jgi:hypothetical protein
MEVTGPLSGTSNRCVAPHYYKLYLALCVLLCISGCNPVGSSTTSSIVRINLEWRDKDAEHSAAGPVFHYVGNTLYGDALPKGECASMVCNNNPLEENTLKSICDYARRHKINLVLAGPVERLDKKGWLLYLVANLNDQKISFDVAGVDSIDFAPEQKITWPIVLQKGGFALDITFEENNSRVRINKCILSSF